MKQKIFDATNGGLDIILYYYPQAREVVEGRAKHFKMRAAERTASTTVKKFGQLWYVTDFGDDQTARNAIDLTMREENINFSQALYLLADRFNVDCGFKPEVNKPDITTRTPHEDETEGSITWDAKKEPEESDLQALGTYVKAETLQRYKVLTLKSYSITKRKENGQLITTVIKSNPNYPIFLYQFDGFQKICCPYAYDKANRFRYIGEKKKDIIYGLEQVIAAYNKLNEPTEDEITTDKKLPEVFLCSGERDALNCAGMGYPVIWLNSETATFGDKEMSRIMRYTEKLINIPDLDATGMLAAYRRSLENWELYTLILPEWLSQYKDRRGKPRKDLTDFCELSGSRQEFTKLIQTAKRCQFWDKVIRKNTETYEINTINLLWYLRCSGFARIEDAVSGQDIYVHVKDYIVRQYTPKQIRTYIKQELERLHIPNTIQKLFQDSKKTTASLMDDLRPINLSFKKSTPDSRTFFFRNCALRVTADDITPIHRNDIDTYTWDTAICPHSFRRTQPTVTLQNGQFTLYPDNIKSNILKVFINTSRMYWREEFENRTSPAMEENQRYRQEHHFDIAGPRLTPAEQHEQMQHLANKCYAIGYLLHQFKFMHMAKAVWVMENRLTEACESSGGSGKSFFFNMLKHIGIASLVTLNGRDRSLTENKHLLERVTQYTDLLFTDDADKNIDLNFFYPLITGDTNINPKGSKSYEISFHDSPIPVFASNFPPPEGKDRSTVRRMLIVVYSDYYHEKGDGDLYNETRTIQDDLGLEVCGSNYTEEQYNADINFLIDCTQLYLNCNRQNIILRPPMENVYKRINIAEMGNSGFYEWAASFFAPDSENIDIILRREEAFKDFQIDTGNRLWTAQKFMKALKAFCENADYIRELNPKELLGTNGRLIRKLDGKTRDCIYIRTKEEINNFAKSSYL